MGNSKLTAVPLTNIAAGLLFFYAFLLCFQIYFHEGEFNSTLLGFSLIYAFFVITLSLAVYKRFGFAEIIAMLLSATYVFSVILSFIGVEEFSDAIENSLVGIILQTLAFIIHSGILLALFRLRYLRSRELTENFQAEKYPDFKKF